MKLVRYVIMAIALCGWGYSAADGNAVRIGGGPKTGAYITIAKSICDAMGKLFNCQALETKGTTDNKELLEAGGIEFGLAKANVAEEWLKDPKFAEKYTLIRRIGDESVFVFAKPETLTAIGSWTGVRENAFLLSIGLPGEKSGDAAVFKILQSVPDSPLVNIEVKMYKDRPALVDAVRSGDVNLGFITQVPDPENELFTLINNAKLTIMGVVDPDMVMLGDSFRVKTVTVKNAAWLGLAGAAQQIETANVQVAIVATKPDALQGRMAMIQKAAIKKIEEASEPGLLPQVGWMQNLANTTTIQAGAQMEGVLRTMSEAAKGARERLQKK